MPPWPILWGWAIGVVCMPPRACKYLLFWGGKGALHWYYDSCAASLAKPTEKTYPRFLTWEFSRNVKFSIFAIIFALKSVIFRRGKKRNLDVAFSISFHLTYLIKHVYPHLKRSHLIWWSLISFHEILSNLISSHLQPCMISSYRAYQFSFHLFSSEQISSCLFSHRFYFKLSHLTSSHVETHIMAPPSSDS